VYSANQIGNEGAEALARSLERNSSLTSLDLSGHFEDMDAFCARVISHVYSGNEIGKEGAEALARSLERNSSLTSLHLSCTLADMDAFHVRVSFLTCIQTMRSERKGQKHWLEHWSATRPLSLSISEVHSADMDAFSARVISHVYSVNGIGKEGAKALARSLERNSSLTSLDFSGTLYRYGCVPHACHFSRVFRQSDRK
jgi:Ran GTPase-activating protein (RanGAP) involved in mRNA processing and transport